LSFPKTSTAVATAAGNPPTGSSDGFRDGLCRHGIPVCHYDCRACGGKGLGNGTTYASPCAGNKRDRFIESEVGRIIHGDSPS
jgi:hypothetical protein